jgi:diaminopimelate epimerase
MIIPFYKYEGTGNDFIIIDDRLNRFPVNQRVISKICNRKTGIGSDGLILIKKSEKAGFQMDFYNPDGSQSFCGNGSRCAIAFAFRMGITGRKTNFMAIDGLHTGELLDNHRARVSMKDVPHIENSDMDLVLDTGSPHYVRFVPTLENENIVAAGKAIRYSDRFKQDGINVNLVEKLTGNSLSCQTYERGVEDETLSCGTGVTAVALAANYQYDLQPPISVLTKGGTLEINFKKTDNGFTSITLEGPATPVFKGEIDV